MEGTLLSKVYYREKSEWQKRDCLYCEDPSTQEAVVGTTMVRCCTKAECMRKATKLASVTGEFPKKTKPKLTKLQLLTKE